MYFYRKHFLPNFNFTQFFSDQFRTGGGGGGGGDGGGEELKHIVTLKMKLKKKKTCWILYVV